MSYWIEDHLGWILGVVIVGLLVLVVWSTSKESAALDTECTAMMQMARTPHDSLEARIACNKM